MNIFSVPNIDQVQKAIEKEKREQRMKISLLRALKSGDVKVNVPVNRRSFLTRAFNFSFSSKESI